MARALDVDRAHSVVRTQAHCLLEGRGSLFEASPTVLVHGQAVKLEEFGQLGEATLVVEVEDLVHRDRLRLALDDHLVDDAAAVGAAQLAEGVFADQDLRAVGLARAFEPRGEIHAVADHGEIHALGRADIAGDQAVGIQTDPDVYRRLSLRGAANVPLGQNADHADRGADRAILVVFVGHRHAEAGHDRVADELVEHPAVLLDALDHQREVLVQQAHGRRRPEPLGHRGKAADVGEQHGRGDRLAAEQAGAARHQLSM